MFNIVTEYHIPHRKNRNTVGCFYGKEIFLAVKTDSMEPIP
jgi:hypothetical protein